MLAELRPEIQERIRALTNASYFNLPELLKELWPEDAVKARQLGKEFRSNLDEFPGVTEAGKDSANLRWYRKD